MTTETWFVHDEDGYPTSIFESERLARVRMAPLPDQRDLDAALTLLDAIGDCVEAWDGGDTEESRYLTEEAIRTLQVICHRLGLEVDLTSNLDVRGNRRRRYEVWEMLRPVHDKLLAYERNLLARELEATGWPTVEVEIEALREAWRDANSAQNYSSVGNQAVRVLEVLSDAVDLDDIPRHQTKNRLLSYLDQQAGGHANTELKKIVEHAFNLAQGVKHDRQPSRMKAGSAASAAILVASMIRTSSEPV